MLHMNNLIAGEWVAAADGAVMEVTDPATDEVVGVVPRSGPAEARAAVAAAHGAWPAWRERTAADRGAVIRRLGDLMLRDQDRLARLLTREQGKPLAEAVGEISYAASYLHWAAEEGKRVYGDIIPASAPNKRILVLRQPVGVVAIITPWNFPAAMIARKIGPALAAGCTAVVKPAEVTPLSALAMGELAIEAGIPPGVLNIITGDPEAIGEQLLSHPSVRKLSFTGSTKVGRLLMRKAATNLLRLSMELGGHAPFIVFEDADIDAAVAAALANKLRNAGQTCICANRVYVHAHVHDEFVAKLAAAMSALRLGPGLQPGTQVGPLINDAAVAKVEEHVQDALDRGGRLRTGGARARLDGLSARFFQPTLIENVRPDMKFHSEETFGPVAPVRAFESEEEALRWANDSPYGLASYFFTRDASRLMRVAEALEFGIVGANDAAPSTAQAPFGGVKHSGFGREGGRYVMDDYTQLKYVAWSL